MGQSAQINLGTPATGLGRGRVAALLPAAVLVALLLAIGAVVPSFLTAGSLAVLAGESSVIMVMAIGQTVVILLGRIDLSVAALASFASVLIALVVPLLGLPGLLLVLALMTAIGATQGLAHHVAQVPSFVVTLGGLGLWSGMALTIAHTTIPVYQGYETVGWLQSSLLGVPDAFGFAVAALTLVAAALRWTPIGRAVYAIGLAEPAAILSGLQVGLVKVGAFALSGLCAGLAGMVMVSRTYSGNPTIADSLLLPSIAAVVVGGTAITGGIGGLGRTLVGVLTVGVLRVGMAVMGLDPAYEPLAYGALIIIAVALTIDRVRTLIVK
jgi:ribose transport system permease protein